MKKYISRLAFAGVDRTFCVLQSASGFSTTRPRGMSEYTVLRPKPSRFWPQSGSNDECRKQVA